MFLARSSIDADPAPQGAAADRRRGRLQPTMAAN